MKIRLKLLLFPFVAVVLATAYFSIWHMRILNWSHTTATINFSTVQFISTGGTRGYNKPIISFQYTVDGHTYTSNRLEAGEDYWSLIGSTADAERVVNRFPAGGTFTAFFDPEEPSEAVLLPGLPFRFVAVSICLYLFFSVGLQSLVLDLAARFKRTPRASP